jgi:hypothetical protein
MTTKKQIVRATLTLELPVEGAVTVVEAMDSLRDTLEKCRELTAVSGKIELVKISDTGKQSRTALGPA